MTMTVAELVADARQRIREVTPVDFDTHNGAHLIIDVREPGEFASGHLEGAVNIPRGVLEFQLDAHPTVQRSSGLVIYCRTGGRAALAADSLRRLGFTDVRSIAGGIEAWREAGLPVAAP